MALASPWAIILRREESKTSFSSTIYSAFEPDGANRSLACLFRQHDWNAVADRIGKLREREISSCFAASNSSGPLSAGTPEFQELWVDGPSRRSGVELMRAFLRLGGCPVAYP